MKIIKNIYLLASFIFLLSSCISIKRTDTGPYLQPTANDSLRYSKHIETSLLLLRLIQSNQRDSILNFYMNDHLSKTYGNYPQLMNSTFNDALGLIKEFGLPTQKQMTFKTCTSGESSASFPDKYGVAFRFNLAPNKFKNNFGLIEFYFTEDQNDKVSIIYSSDPKLGRK
jgi:hypothetical protein